MHEIRLRKQLAKAETDISFDSDRAITDFRAFYAIAELHTQRVDNPSAIEMMEEVLDNLRENLQNRKQVLQCS